MSDKDIKNVEEKDNELQKKIDEISAKITENVLKSVEKSMENVEKESGKNIKKFFSKSDTEKKTDFKAMNLEERIYTYWKALITGDMTTVKYFSDEAKKKALEEGVAATGGNLIPQDMYGEILKELRQPARQRSLVKVVPMKTNVKTFVVEQNRVNVYWTSEAAVKTTSTATWKQDTITAYKMAAILNATDELLSDSYLFDVVKEIVAQFAQRIGDVEDQVITAGTGVGQPTGFVTAAPAAVACAGGGITFTDINNLYYTLPTQYRMNCIFQIHNQNIRKIAAIRDTMGRYLYNDSQANGDPATLKGRPVIENNWLPANQIYVGDFKQGYYLGDKQAMTVETNRYSETAWTQDLTSIRVVERIGGDLLIPNAVRRLTGVS